MILFTVLLISLIGLLTILAAIIFAGGVGFITVFGDVIVFGLVVWLIVTLISKIKK